MSITRVCSSCFDDPDLRAWIRDQEGGRGCDACHGYDSPTCNIDELCEYIEGCLKKYWGFAVEQLPYESAEGGYQGQTWSTYELLADEVQLSLPRDYKDGLFYTLTNKITDEAWCDYDWLSLDTDEVLATSWDRFCEVVKHERRFFFHTQGNDTRDSFTPASLLQEIADISLRLGLIREVPEGTKLWRARTDLSRRTHIGPSDFGPPPAHLALQSNRMNPPGIPMLYLASSTRTALLETRVGVGRVGQWIAVRPLRVLDLRKLPAIPGCFSNVGREHRLTIRFLHHFADDIMTPVARDNQVHVEYLPSQVITEYFKDLDLEGGKLDGIAYDSTVNSRGWNLAVFAAPTDLGLEEPRWRIPSAPWFRFGGVKSARLNER